MIFKKTIKKSLGLFGLKLSKIPKGGLSEADQYKWLQEMNFGTVIDIGASKGNASLQFHKLFPKAQIYAFEPLTDCFNLMNEKLKSVSKFKSYNIALGDSAGESKIFRSSYSGASSLRKMGQLQKEVFPVTAGEKIEAIRVDTLDNVLGDKELEKNIFVKMDVQGFEDKVIAGGKKVIGQAKAILIETSYTPLYEGQPLFGDIFKLLSELGFKYSGVWGPGDFKSPVDGLPLQQDSIFIKHTT